MNGVSIRFVSLGVVCLGLCGALHAQPPAPGLPTAVHTAHRHDLVGVGHNSDLPFGQQADSVVSIMGSSSSEGEARDNVVSVLGNTRVTGPVGEDAVAVLGNTYINSKIGGNAVAVLGNVELGPNADIGGDVVAIRGRVVRDPMAIVHGSVREGSGRTQLGSQRLSWARPWIRHGLLYLRPLALGPGLGWAWAIGLAFLALYTGLALLFRAEINQCVQTLERNPGQSILAAVLAALLTPIVLLLLVITLIGIAAVPVVLLALLCGVLFGKAAVLAWLGRRCLGGARAGALGHPAVAVLIGGLIVLALYLVPVLGLLVYKLLGLLGLGVVIYALILAPRQRHGGAGAVAAPAASTDSPAHAPSAAPSTAPSAAANAAPSAAAAVLSTGLPRAGFWIRILALLLDALLVGVMVHLLPGSRHLWLLALAVYGAVMWKLRGTTIGGIVFHLHVVRLDGRPVDWPTVIVRALGCFLSLAIVGLGFFWIAFDVEKQAWHDKFAGTIVVRSAAAAPLV